MSALPAFAGQLTVDDRNRISAISRKALRWGVTHTAFDIEEIIDNFDRKLFSKITHSGHCLHYLLPPKTSEHCSYSLRIRKHYYQLPNVEFSLYKYCFINRCLFKFRWYSVCFVLFLMFYVFYSFLSLFTFHSNSVCLTYCIKGYLIWLDLSRSDDV